MINSQKKESEQFNHELVTRKQGLADVAFGGQNACGYFVRLSRKEEGQTLPYHFSLSSSSISGKLRYGSHWYWEPQIPALATQIAENQAQFPDTVKFLILSFIFLLLCDLESHFFDYLFRYLETQMGFYEFNHGGLCLFVCFLSCSCGCFSSLRGEFSWWVFWGSPLPPFFNSCVVVVLIF